MSKTSFIIPSKNESGNIRKVLTDILELKLPDFEIIIVVDSKEDRTLETLESYEVNQNIFPLINIEDPGPAGAIRAGIKNSKGSTLVITMADGSDEISITPMLISKINNGASLVCASRYTKGGKSLNAPFLKSKLSKLAGLSLYHFAGIGTRDSTNAFKVFDRKLLDATCLESKTGFTIGLELVVKAKELGMKIEEVPTIWRERAEGKSNFKVFKWLPNYLYWYKRAFFPVKR